MNSCNHEDGTWHRYGRCHLFLGKLKLYLTNKKSNKNKYKKRMKNSKNNEKKIREYGLSITVNFEPSVFPIYQLLDPITCDLWPTSLPVLFLSGD